MRSSLQKQKVKLNINVTVIIKRIKNLRDSTKIKYTKKI